MKRKATPAASAARGAPQAVIARLLRLLPQAARQTRPGVVHRLRTHLRRTEALLSVRPPAQADAKLTKQLQKLRRRAGRVRDLDVHLGLLRGVHVEGDASGRQALLEAMEHRREREAARLRGKLDPAARRELVRRLRRARIAAAEGTLTGAERRRRLARDASGLEARFSTLDAGNLHQFRIACKRLRYLAEAGGAELESVAAQLKRAQDAIGTWHDWLELTRRAERAHVQAAHSALLAALRNLAAAQYAEALRVAVATRDAWPFVAVPRRQAGGTGGAWARIASA